MHDGVHFSRRKPELLVNVNTVERIAAGELRSVNAQVDCLLREALKARGIKLSDLQPVKRGRPATKALKHEGDT